MIDSTNKSRMSRYKGAFVFFAIRAASAAVIKRDDVTKHQVIVFSLDKSQALPGEDSK